MTDTNPFLEVAKEPEKQGGNPFLDIVKEHDSQGVEPEAKQPTVRTAETYGVTDTGKESPKPSRALGDLVDIMSAPAKSFHTGIEDGGKEIKEGIKNLGASTSVKGNISSALSVLHGIGKGLIGVTMGTVGAPISMGFEAAQKGVEALPPVISYPPLTSSMPSGVFEPQVALNMLSAPLRTSIEQGSQEFLKNHPTVAKAVDIADMVAPALVLGMLKGKGNGAIAEKIQDGKDVKPEEMTEAQNTLKSATQVEYENVGKQIFVDHLHADIAPIAEKGMNLQQDKKAAEGVIGQENANKIFNPKIAEQDQAFNQQAQNLSDKAKLEAAKEAVPNEDGKAVIDEHLKNIQDQIEKLNPKKPEDATKKEQEPIGVQGEREGGDQSGETDQASSSNRLLDKAQSEEKATPPTSDAEIKSEEIKTNEDGKEESPKEKGNEEGVLTPKVESTPVSEAADHTKITTAEQAHSFAKENGFTSANHLLNSINKSKGTDFKNIQEIPKPVMDKFLESKTEKSATGKEIEPHKEVSASQSKAVEDVIAGIHTDLKPMEAAMLFSEFKDKDLEAYNNERGTETTSISDGIKKKQFEKLQEKGYVQEIGDGYTITDKGRKFIDNANARLETRKSVKSGTDLFPEDANIKELKQKVKNKIADGVNGIVNKLGAKKNLLPEEKTKLFDDIKDIVEGAVKLGHLSLKEAVNHVIESVKKSEWYKSMTEGNMGDVDKVIADIGNHFVEKEPKTITGIKNAQVDEERTKRGFQPAMQTAKKEMGQSWDEAMKIMEDSPDRQTNLINELKNKPRPLSDVENSMLLHKQIELQNEYEKVNEAINHARENKDYPVAEENRLRLARISDDLQDVYNIGKAVGTENARGLNTRKMMAKEDYSLAAMETQKRAANRGEKLTPKQEEEIRTLHEKIQSTQKAFDKYVKEAEDRISKSEAEKAVEGVVKETRRAKRTADKQAIRTEREVIINSIKDKLKSSRSTLSANPIPLDVLPDVAKLVKNYAQEGVLKLDDLVDKIHDDLKDVIGGLGKRDVQNAISGYGYKKGKQTLGELTTQVNELKKQARLSSRLEDLEAGRIPAKTERAKIQQSKEIEELKGKIKSKEGKEKLRQRTEELQKKIAEGDYTTKERKTTPLDRDALLLKAKNERAKQDFKLGLEKDRLKSETRSEFLQRWFIKIERAGKLSSPVTLGKLTSAAITRQAITPLEEGVGTIWSKAFPKLAEGAPREAGLNIRAEAKALSEAWSAGLKDASDVLKSGKSDLDIVYGKSKLPPEAIDFFGKLHGALKTTAKRGEFARSFEKRSAYKMKQGIDMTDPLAQLETGIEAYKDANRSIFLQDNKVASFWTDHIVGGAERSGLKPLATTLNWLVPFVKIPTNIVGETTTYVTGLPHGLLKTTYNILTDGIDKMSAEEKDRTLRMLKKGSLGAAALYIGYKNPQMFGGFYQKGEKRKEGDPKAMQIKVGNHNVPAWLFESPIFQAFQLGATTRHLMDYYSQHPKQGDEASAIGATVLGLAEELPMVGQGVRLNDLFGKPNEREYYLGELAKNTVDPLMLQTIAKWMDEDANGFQDWMQKDANKRYPQGGLLNKMKESVETGLPLLRQNVSKNKKYSIKK